MRATNRGQRPRPGTCVYCGREAVVEDEHVFPRCLWRKSDRHGVEFIYVPACKPCNNDKSRYDDALRDRIDVDITSSERAEHQEQVETIKRSTWYGSSSIGRSVTAAIEAAKADPDSAVWPLEVNVDPEPFLRAVEYIIRGLYYHHTGTVLAKDHSQVSVKYLPIGQMLEWLGRYTQYAHEGGGAIGDVCRWTYDRSRTDSFRSHWVLLFKDGVVFLGSTAQPAQPN